MTPPAHPRDAWATRAGFLMAAIGSAVASLGDVPSSFAVSAAATGVADGSGFIAIASSRLTVRSLKQ